MIRLRAPSLSNPAPYCLNFVIVAICAVAELFCLPLYGAWWTFAIVFIVLPLIDLLISFNDLNPSSQEEIKELEKIVSFRVITWVWVPLQILLILSSTNTAFTVIMGEGAIEKLLGLSTSSSSFSSSSSTDFQLSSSSSSSSSSSGQQLADNHHHHLHLNVDDAQHIINNNSNNIQQYHLLGETLLHAGTTILTVLGVLISTGIGTGALGITIAHEMIHKTSLVEQLCGKILLASTSYGHWYSAHLLGHHKLVGTDRDPASAHYGESFWTFWRRSIVGEFFIGVELEAERLRKQGLSFWSSSNPIVHIWLLSLLFLAGMYSLFGWFGPVFFVAQSVVAISLLICVNYIEHYGLQRPPGTAISIHHSWNSQLSLSNYLLFKLQRHPDHHLHAKRRYQALCSIQESPQHPHGYPLMILIALVPPLWFRIINPLVPDQFKPAALSKASSHTTSSNTTSSITTSSNTTSSNTSSSNTTSSKSLKQQ